MLILTRQNVTLYVCCLPCYYVLISYAFRSLTHLLANFFSVARQPLLGQGPLLIIETSRSHWHTHTHTHTHKHSALLLLVGERPVIKTSLPDTTQNSQERDIHAPGGIRTHNPSKTVAADPRLRPRGHWGSAQGTHCNKFRQFTDYFCKNFNCNAVLTVFFRHRTTL